MSTQTRRKIRLGELLVEHKMITEKQINAAMAKQRDGGGKLGDILIEMGDIKEQELLDFLSDQLQIPFVDLKHCALKPDLIRQLPETYARRFRALLLEHSPSGFMVGMADPQDIYATDELTRILKQPIEIALVRESDLLSTIDLVYRRTEEIIKFAAELTEDLTEGEYDLARLGQSLGASDAPVVKMLQSIFEDAVQVSASDIHIEPDETVLRIRQRVDGVLQEHVMPKTRIAPALAVRLKLMAGLNIAEHRLPQDGRFSIKVKGRNMDVRLSTMPMQYGESLVMRLLDNSTALLNLDQTGMPKNILHSLRRLMRMPYGMILVTGPTGSGKTTTLYGVLSELNSPTSKIITVEDPVEYRLPRINQIQVNPQIDLDFSRVLRSALRQDPDIIMVGEIRDKETTSIALRAAMTGHLVLATMHTNDTISAVMRLLDMQSEGYLVAAALRAVLAQRLIRRLCDSCAKTYEPTASEVSWLTAMLGSPLPKMKFKAGSGCTYCNQTGYKGRVGVYELLELDADMIDALRCNDPGRFARAVQNNPSQSLWRSALDVACQGVTSLQEVMRVSTVLEDNAEVASLLKAK